VVTTEQIASKGNAEARRIVNAVQIIIQIAHCPVEHEL